VVCNARPAVAEVLVRYGAAASVGPQACHTLDDALLYVGARLPATRDPDGATWPPRRQPTSNGWSNGWSHAVARWPGETLLRITPTFQPLGLRLEGEVDITNTTALANALTRMINAGRDVRLDLSHVVSIDVAGLRLLARTAAGLPRDRSLLLDPVPRHLRQVLSLSGWDQTPSLRLDAALR
jgi:anti-anti-sigma factor